MNRDQLFVSCLFWYSFLFTSLTPLARIVHKQWLAITLSGALPAYPSVADSPAQDKTFSLHAAFALSWLLVSYMQICFVRDRRLHRVCGYISVITFALHSAGALRILYEDVEQHTLLNRTLLLLSIAQTAKSMFDSIRAAKQGNLTLHRRLAVETFIRSLDGAGTIRTIGAIQTAMGVGPVFCEVQHHHVGGHCDWSYTIRMCLTGLLRLGQLAAYTRCDQVFMCELKQCLGAWTAILASYAMGLDQTEAFVALLALYASMWLLNSAGASLWIRVRDDESKATLLERLADIPSKRLGPFKGMVSSATTMISSSIAFGDLESFVLYAFLVGYTPVKLDG